MAKKYSVPRPVARKASFEDLVSRVPVNVFVAMAGKSGLPNADARELCLAFKKLKSDSS